MNACDPQADNVFGPRVSVSCRGGLDFTLLFEQAILSIVPSGIAIVASVAYLYHLWWQSVKTIPDAGWWLRIGKQVSHFSGHLSDVWRAFGLVKLVY